MIQKNRAINQRLSKKHCINQYSLRIARNIRDVKRLDGDFESGVCVVFAFFGIVKIVQRNRV